MQSTKDKEKNPHLMQHAANANFKQGQAFRGIRGEFLGVLFTGNAANLKENLGIPSWGLIHG